MKKILIFLILLMVILIFSSCTTNTSGYTYELITQNWTYNGKNNTKLNLKFDNNVAKLTAFSNNKTTVINGKYLIDNNSFIIYQDNKFQTYKFNYEIKGDYLILSYNEDFIKLSKVNF